VVDDDAALRDVLPRILKPLGYELLVAASGAEALVLADRPGQKPIQLLVTDMVMEGMSGSQLASRLDKKCPGLRVLFISGYSDEIALGDGFFAQGIAFLAKPFNADSLSAKVRELLDRSGSG
jgi:DNA-binding response OmpR family regulator